MPKALNPVTSWERAPSGHVLLGGRANQGEDELSLVQITAAAEDRFAFEHFTKDTAKKRPRLDMSHFQATD